MKRKKVFIVLLVVLFMFILLITYWSKKICKNNISLENKNMNNTTIIDITKPKEEIAKEELKEETKESETKYETHITEETKEVINNNEVTQDRENELISTSNQKQNSEEVPITNNAKKEENTQNVIEEKKNEIVSDSNTQDKEIINDNKEAIEEKEQEEQQNKEEVKKEETQKDTKIVEKSIYDYAFDIEEIKLELIKIGQGMGLTHITEDDGITKNPNNSSWSDPVRASSDFQGKRLERALKDYVSSMPILIKAYGGGDIKTFTIYVENNGNGNYTFYFLY